MDRCVECRVELTPTNRGPHWAPNHCDHCTARLFDERLAQENYRMTDTIDPALFDNVQELLDIAREIGAEPHLFSDPEQIRSLHLEGATAATTLHFPNPPRTVVILAFTQQVNPIEELPI